MSKVVFAYGSLLCERSRQRSIAQPGRIVPCTAEGLQRLWNVHSAQLGGGITFLGVEERSGALCNGLLLELNDADYATVAAREGAYGRLKLPWSRFHLHGRFDGPAPESVIAFGHRSDDRPNAASPLVQSYIDLCLEGCLEIEEGMGCAGFLADFIRQTGGWSHHWVNDRIHARRPFAEYPLAGRIDQGIREHLADYVPHIRIGG